MYINETIGLSLKDTDSSESTIQLLPVMNTMICEELLLVFLQLYVVSKAVLAWLHKPVPILKCFIVFYTVAKC